MTHQSATALRETQGTIKQPTATPPELHKLYLPKEIWAIVFSYAAIGGEIHLNQDVVQHPKGIISLQNDERYLFTLCRRSREELFKCLVLYIDVHNISTLHDIPQTILREIQHVQRSLSVPAYFYQLKYTQLNLDDLPALRTFNTIIKHQVKRIFDSPLLDEDDLDAMFQDPEYKKLVSMANRHFTRLDDRSTESYDCHWMRYWKYPELEGTIDRIKEKGCISTVKEDVDITITYELTNLMRPHLQALQIGVALWAFVWYAGTPVRDTYERKATVVLSWKTGFPKHEIREKMVVRQDGWPKIDPRVSSM